MELLDARQPERILSTLRAVATESTAMSLVTPGLSLFAFDLCFRTFEQECKRGEIMPTSRLRMNQVNDCSRGAAENAEKDKYT